MKKAFSLTLVLGLGALYFGCGSDGPSIPTSTTSLTDSEAQAVSDALNSGGVSAFTTGTGSIDQAVTRMAIRALTINESVSASETINCESGTIGVSGTVTVNGDIDETTGSGTINVTYNLSQTFNDCVISAESTPVTLGGTVNAAGLFGIEGSETSFAADFTGTVTGGITVDGVEGGSGTCGVNMTSTGTVDNSGATVASTGSVCDRTINYQFSYNDI